MRNRSIPAIAIVLVLVGVWWSLSADEPAPAEQQADGSSRPAIVPKQTGQTAKMPPPGYRKLTPDEEKLLAHLDKLNVDIELYSRVLDQFDKPVEAAKVSIYVHNQAAWPPVPSDRVLTTDVDGRFSVTGARGDRLRIRAIAKQNHLDPVRKDPANRTFSADRLKSMKPDPQQPLIYRLPKRLGNDQPVLKLSDVIRGRADGTTYTYDFLTKNQSEDPQAEGDIRVAYHKGPPDTSNLKWDWSAKIEAIGGGFVDVQNEAEGTNQWMAPERGYEKKILDWEMKASDPNWTNGPAKHVYFRTRNGQVHGMCEVTMGPSPGRTPTFSVHFSGRLNPSSRNLETSYEDDNLVGSYSSLKQWEHRPRGPRPEVTYREEPPASLPPTKGPFVRERTAKAGFHGKIVDEQGQPIQDVDVEIRAISAKAVQAQFSGQPVTQSQFQPVIHRAKTTPQGTYFLPDVYYATITVHEIARQGYLLQPLFDRTFSFGLPHTKDVGQTAENPWIVRMWRRRGSPQPLITADMQLTLEPTGEPRVVSLAEPTAEDGSQFPARLKLAIHRHKDDGYVMRHDWSVSVESLDGEIAEVDDLLTFEAPRTGYRRKLEWTSKRGDPAHLNDLSYSPSRIRRQLFLRTDGDTMYARIIVDASRIGSEHRPPKSAMHIRSSVNPTGSRNLEPDPDRTFGSLKEYRDRTQSP